MDVQATTTTATLLPPIIPSQPAVSSPSVPDLATASASAGTVPIISGPDSGSSSKSGGSASTAIGPTPGLATLPAANDKAPGSPDDSLSAGVAKLFNAAEQNVSVSFRAEPGSNEIVTVFTDKDSGKVIVQFPSETLIALGKFFDKLDGGVVNKKV
jgi:hypothetical protein